MKYRELKGESGLYPVVRCRLRGVDLPWSQYFDALIDTGSAVSIIPGRLARASQLTCYQTVNLGWHADQGIALSGRLAYAEINIKADCDFALNGVFVVLEQMRNFAILGNDMLRKCRLEFGPAEFSITAAEMGKELRGDRRGRK